MQHTPISEKPIIFQGHSVLSIISGQKIQTRRVVKPQPIEDVDPEDCTGYTYLDGTRNEDGTHITKFTKYCPGIRLWVKEAWGVFDHCNYDGTNMGHEFAICYKADGDNGDAYWKDSGKDIELERDERWRNPLFMPRWASRITLEVTDVRIQRLQDISEEDAEAEGVTPVISKKIHGWTPCVLEFRLIWDEINWKKHPWKSNPWVYAISFRVGTLLHMLQPAKT